MADTLFSFDDEQVVNNGPVTCLGIEFENDDKRREFFREELRKKLPELRLIEGFPIGKDEDIIALSDPPYYTACPNPWLNDFIKEWEAEKEGLADKGKRIAGFDVKEPYASDVSEGKSNPIYTAHSYHTKVPHPAIMRYLLHYTQPGDIVFDGFAGTGMTGVAAQACGDSELVKALGVETRLTGHRHAICSDLSPIASFIDYNFNSPVSIKLVKQEIDRITKEMEDEYGWMYRTTHHGKPVGKINCIIWSDLLHCPHCGQDLVFWDAAVDYANKCMKDDFTCPHCGGMLNKKNAKPSFETVYDQAIDKPVEKVKSIPVLVVYDVEGKRFQRPPEEYDFEVIEKVNNSPITNPYPTTILPEGAKTADPKNSHKIFHSHQFFTKRSLIAVSALRQKIKESKAPNNLMFILTGMLTRCTVMSRVHISNFFHGGGGWNVGLLNNTLYVPSAPVETSIIDLLKSRTSTYLRALPFLPKEYCNISSLNSATQCGLRDNSVDYIFVDPPFGANINYSELNFLQEDWLGLITNNKDEAIENPSQGKNKQFYQDAMVRSFSEFYRVLKPGRWITIEFSNTSAAIWNIIQYTLQTVGFVVSNVAAIDKQQGSFNAVTSTTAVKQDLVITCFKPTDEFINSFSTSKDVYGNAWDFIEELLVHLPVHIKKNDATATVVERTPKILYDRLVSYYVQNGFQVPMDAVSFQRGLKERFVERDGMYFTAEQVIEYEDKKKNTSSFVSLALLVGSEAEGIEWLKRKLEGGPKTYSDILPDWMQDLVRPKKGDVLPELMQILDENFLKDENGYWHIPDLNDQAQLDAIKTKRLLKEFEVYVEAKKVKNARLEALRAGFKECYKNKDFATIVAVGDKIEEELLTTDEVLLRFYDIASSRV